MLMLDKTDIWGSARIANPHDLHLLPGDPNRPVCECDEFGAFTYAPVRSDSKENPLKRFLRMHQP